MAGKVNRVTAALALGHCLVEACLVAGGCGCYGGVWGGHRLLVSCFTFQTNSIASDRIVSFLAEVGLQG